MKTLHKLACFLVVTAILPCLLLSIEGVRWPMLALAAATMVLAATAPKAA